MTRRRVREIHPDRWTDPGLLRVPSYMTRLTGIGLWGIVDDEGRIEFRPDLIAGAIYPGDPAITATEIETHVLQLDEAGFLTLYTGEGRTWIELARPLKTARPKPSECPPNPRSESSGTFMAVGGGRARAREQVLAEGAERESEWARWAEEQERAPRPPSRPLLMDAPPIGCPEHPNGRFADCGPCGTARRRHDRWVAQQRYEEQLTAHHAAPRDDDEQPW